MKLRVRNLFVLALLGAASVPSARADSLFTNQGPPTHVPSARSVNETPSPPAPQTIAPPAAQGAPQSGGPAMTAPQTGTPAPQARAPAPGAGATAAAPAVTTTTTTATTTPALIGVDPATLLARPAQPFSPLAFQPPGRCRHVIDMLYRHCLLDHARKAPFGAPQFTAPPGFPVLGDLQLVGVNLLKEAGPECGPSYQVLIRNDSQYPMYHFRISMVAVHGQISDNSPILTLNVPRLAAGESATLEFALPVAVMAMGPQGGETIPFETLVVVLDAYDQYPERDELNNVATLKRVEIGVIETSTIATAPAAATPGEGGAPAAGPPGPSATAPPPAGTSPAPGTTPEAAPEAGNPGNPAPSPLDNLNLDQLNLDDEETATSLFSKQR